MDLFKKLPGELADMPKLKLLVAAGSSAESEHRKYTDTPFFLQAHASFFLW